MGMEQVCVTLGGDVTADSCDDREVLRSEMGSGGYDTHRRCQKGEAGNEGSKQQVSLSQWYPFTAFWNLPNPPLHTWLNSVKVLVTPGRNTELNEPRICSQIDLVNSCFFTYQICVINQVNHLTEF